MPEGCIGWQDGIKSMATPITPTTANEAICLSG